MSNKTLRIATRKSPLALWQAKFVGEQLSALHPGLQIELVPMSTSGDQFTKDKLLAAGGKGLFIKELEEALLNQTAELAVHSMKDVPASFPQGLGIAAICKRENPYDALISRHGQTLAQLPQAAVIGTASLRRASQILAFRPDFNIKLLRGNIHTRLKKLEEASYDAIILAAAGLERMNLGHLMTEQLAEDLMLPACGQGALGIECRLEDQETLALIKPLNHALSAICLGAERRVNAKLGGNCHVPLAVFCQPMEEGRLFLKAKICSEDGKKVIVCEEQSKQNKYIQAADRCAQSLMDQGAAKLLALDH